MKQMTVQQKEMRRMGYLSRIGACLLAALMAVGLFALPGAARAEEAQLVPVDFLVWVNNERLTDGMEVKDGDDVILTFNWRIPNNLDAGVFI